jgi:hypothetical protein
MGVAVVGGAVGGPPGVPDAGARLRQWVVGQRLVEVRELAGPLACSDLSVADEGDAGGVVAAVLQPAQALHDDLQGRLAADVTHDAAHGCQGIHP